VAQHDIIIYNAFGGIKSLTRNLDIVTGLVKVKTVIPKVKAMSSDSTGAFGTGGGVSIDDGDDLVCSGRAAGGGYCKIINLPAD
jgi:hypothetical protein